MQRVGRWGRALSCGPFRGERYAGSLRWLCVDGTECVRMVGLVVRDRAWRTLLPTALRERQGVAAWTLEARTPVGTGVLAWRLLVAARPRGIDVRATMRAEGDIVTNRAGIVVLLPAATFAGATYAAGHVDGSTTRGRLPRRIAPHQPMLDLRGVRLAARGGPTLALGFEGETFEMEDHRNWLDPSFKLYSRALSRPTPYRLRDGACVEQRVTIDVERGAPARRRRTFVARRGPLPALGIATAPGRLPGEAVVIDALREVQPSFVWHRTDGQARDVAAADGLAAALGCALRLESFGDGSALAAAIARAVPQAVAAYRSGPGVARVLAQRGIPSSGGTFADFVMLNRSGNASDAARTTFGLCPTVHARDDRSLVESLETLPTVFAQARRIAGSRPLDVGPCALLRRLVPKSGRPATSGPFGEGDYDVDPRQYALIAAAWLATTIAVSAVSGVSSVCTFEAEGDRGLVRRRRRTGTTTLERSPAHAVLAGLARRNSERVTLLDLDVRHGAAFVLEGVTVELWLVDLSGCSRALPPVPDEAGGVRRLRDSADGAVWSNSGQGRRMNAYGIARIAIASACASDVELVARSWCSPTIRS